LTDTAADLSLKQLELLKGILPRLSRVGVLLNPDNLSHPAQLTRLVLAGQKMGVQVVLAEAVTVTQIEPGFALLARERAHAVVLFGDTFFAQQVHEIANVALKHRLSSVFIVQDYADAGGLMSFGAPIIDNFGGLRRTSTRSSRARLQLNCRSSSPPGIHWSSTRKPPRPSVSRSPIRSGTGGSRCGVAEGLGKVCGKDGIWLLGLFKRIDHAEDSDRRGAHAWARDAAW
jgi:hypothetical protein